MLENSPPPNLQVLHRWLGQKVLPTYLVNDIIPTDNDLLTLEFQDQVVNLVNLILVDNDDIKYFQTFLKLFIRRLERASLEVSESLTELYTDILMLTAVNSTPITATTTAATAGISQPTASIVSYFIDEKTQIRILEATNVISANGSTGHRTWEAALCLTDFLLTFPLGGRNGLGAVELGAGTGLVGLAAASLPGINHVLLTDGDQAVVRNLTSNIKLNNQQNVSAARLLWGHDPIPTMATTTTTIDLVLAADVTYDSRIIPVLVSCLSQFTLLKQPPRVLVAATVRSQKTLDVFTKECTKKGIQQVELKRYSRPLTSQFFYIPPASPDVIIYELKQKELAQLLE